MFKKPFAEWLNKDQLGLVPAAALVPVPSIRQVIAKPGVEKEGWNFKASPWSPCAYKNTIA